MGRSITAQMTDALSSQAHLAREILAGREDLAAAADVVADDLGRDLEVRVTVIDGSGRVLGDTGLDGEALARAENHAARPEVAAALRTGEGRAVRHSGTVEERMLYVALRLDPLQPERGIVRLAVPLTAVRRAQREIRLPILLAIGLSAVAAGVFGGIAARGPARRLEEMSRTAADLAEGRLEARAAPEGSDEIAGLAEALNRMAERLQGEIALLARERHQSRTILEGMVEGVVLTDAGGRILLANEAFRRLFGVSLPPEGRRPIEAARVPALQAAVEDALAAPAPLTREIAVGGAADRILGVSLAPVREGSAVVGSVAVFHDVTELKRLEQVRREFVANVSHELRTPLTAITGYAETLRDGALRDPEQAKEFVEVIVRHAGRLRALIEDLLDLSSVEQGEARLRIRPAPVRDIAAQAEAVVRPAADRRGHRLAVDVPEGLPPVLADRDRLAQVLINLLDNAVKFTPDGGRIALAARAAGGRVVLTVSDSGVGIPPGDRVRIFERFYRVDRSRDRKEGGTGLGLAIAKHLVQAMGGSIAAESRPGGGTTFTVSLPAAAGRGAAG